MKFNTDVPLLGQLSITKVYPNGYKKVVFEDKPNLITLAAKRIILNTIYATSLTPDPINNLAVGISGTIDPEGLYPKTPLSSATGLYSSLLSVATSYVEDLTVPSVTFIADLDQGQGNNQLITEAGLFKTSGAMFNIKTFPGIPKTSEFSLHFAWTIKIA